MPKLAEKNTLAKPTALIANGHQSLPVTPPKDIRLTPRAANRCCKFVI